MKLEDIKIGKRYYLAHKDELTGGVSIIPGICIGHISFHARFRTKMKDVFETTCPANVYADPKEALKLIEKIQ